MEPLIVLELVRCQPHLHGRQHNGDVHNGRNGPGKVARHKRPVVGVAVVVAAQQGARRDRRTAEAVDERQPLQAQLTVQVPWVDGLQRFVVEPLGVVRGEGRRAKGHPRVPAQSGWHDALLDRERVVDARGEEPEVAEQEAAGAFAERHVRADVCPPEGVVEEVVRERFDEDCVASPHEVEVCLLRQRHGAPDPALFVQRPRNLGEACKPEVFVDPVEAGDIEVGSEVSLDGICIRAVYGLEKSWWARRAVCCWKDEVAG